MIYQQVDLSVYTSEICIVTMRLTGEYCLYYTAIWSNNCLFNSSCIPYHNDINPYCRQGQDFGDEYFAELDMIESVEGRKEGYESDVDEGQYNLTWLMKDVNFILYTLV